MARKLQIKRGAKANLPTLNQGEFGMCTDSGAEELHIGNGSKNIQIPLVGVYYGDMDELVTSGIYRVGTNSNLLNTLYYGQVLVMQGAESDTVCQIGMGYTDSNIAVRSGQKSGDTWTWNTWTSLYSGVNPPNLNDLDVVKRTGDTMSGELVISNRSDYVGMSKVREISSVPYSWEFAVGNDSTRGASGSLRLTNDAAEVLARIDAWANGELTYKNDDTDYIPILRIETGSYTGTGGYDKSITFKNTPKVVFIGIASTGSGQYAATPYVWGGTVFGVHGSSSYVSTATVTISGNKMSWTGSGNNGLALNWSDKTYKYVAIY